jgi:HEAT repeat protein
MDVTNFFAIALVSLISTVGITPAANAAQSGPVRERDIPMIIQTIGTGSRPQVEQAINQLQFLGTPKSAVYELVRMLKGETPGSRPNAAYALSVLHPTEAGPVFSEILGDEDASLRLAGCQGLDRLKPRKDLLSKLGERLSDPVAAVRRDCAKAIGTWEGKSEEKLLVTALSQEKDPDARLAEIEALGHAGTSAASSPVLEPLLNNSSEEVRFASARSPSGKKALEDWANSKDSGERISAVELLTQVTAPWSTEILAARLDDPSAVVSVKASKALVDRKDPRGLKSLVLRAEHASFDDKFTFETALRELKVTQQQRLDIIQKAGQAH